MKKLLGAIFIAVLGLSFMSTSAFADAGKGQKLYLKKLKKACGFNGAVMSKKHTQAEWKAIEDGGKLKDEIKKLCPKVKDKALKDKYMKHYFDFFYNFASDSGNVPSC